MTDPIEKKIADLASVTPPHGLHEDIMSTIASRHYEFVSRRLLAVVFVASIVLGLGIRQIVDFLVTKQFIYSFSGVFASTLPILGLPLVPTLLVLLSVIVISYTSAVIYSDWKSTHSDSNHTPHPGRN